MVAVAGGDGAVRLIDAATGSVTTEFSPAPISDDSKAMAALSKDVKPLAYGEMNVPTETLPAGATIKSLSVAPAAIDLHGEFSYAQFVATAHLANGDLIDVTRLVSTEISAPVATVSATGVVSPVADGAGKLIVKGRQSDGRNSSHCSDMVTAFEADFVGDVNPVLSRLGCNQGTCHGAAKGKNGFKLSLRGYDPIFDVRALTDDLASRRVNVASPDNSLMLMKATGAVPHVGGQLIRPGEPYYMV